MTTGWRKKQIMMEQQRQQQQALEEKLAECRAFPKPEQSTTCGEPVATLDDLEQEIYENTRQFVSRDVMEWMLKRYYITPPQRTWVGLDEEDDIDWEEGDSLRDLVEAVEAKLKEKNGYA